MILTREQLKGSYSEGEALWCLTKATDEELSSLQPMLHELIDKAKYNL